MPKLQVHVKAGRNGRNGQLLMPTLARIRNLATQQDPHHEVQASEKKRKDYTFRRQFNEKPSIIPGCPVVQASWQTQMIRPTVEQQ